VDPGCVGFRRCASVPPHSKFLAFPLVLTESERGHRDAAHLNYSLLAPVLLAIMSPYSTALGSVEGSPGLNFQTIHQLDKPVQPKLLDVVIPMEAHKDSTPTVTLAAMPKPQNAALRLQSDPPAGMRSLVQHQCASTF